MPARATESASEGRVREPVMWLGIEAVTSFSHDLLQVGDFYLKTGTSQLYIYLPVGWKRFALANP